MQKSLMGFDEINKLTKNSGGGGGSGSLQDLELPDWIKNIGDLIKAGKWAEAGDALAAKMNELVDSVDWTGLGEKFAEHVNHLLDFLTHAIYGFDWKNLGGHIAEFLNKAIADINWYELGQLIAAKIYIAITFLGGLLEKFDGVGAAKALISLTDGIFDMIKKAIDDVDWELVGKNIGEFLRTLWDNVPQLVSDVLSLAKSIVNGIVDFIAGIFAGTTGSDSSSLKKKISDAAEKFFSKIETGISFMLSGEPGLFFDKLKFSVTSFLTKLKDWLNNNAGVAGAVVGGIVGLKFGLIGGVLGATVGSSVALALKDSIKTDDDGLSFNKKAFIDTIINKMRLPTALVAGALVAKFTGGSFTGFLIGTALSMSLLGAIDIDESGNFTFDKQDFESRILRIISTAIVGGIIGSVVPGLGTGIGLTIGASIALVVEGIDLAHKGQSKTKVDELIKKFGAEQVEQYSHIALGANYVLNPNFDMRDASAEDIAKLEAMLNQYGKQIEPTIKNAGAEVSKAYASGFKNFGDALANAGFTPQEQQRYLDEFVAIYEQSGIKAANAYAQGIIRNKGESEAAAKDSAEAAQRAFESGMQNFQSTIERTMSVDEATKSSLLSNYETIFDSLGIEGANAYKNGIISGSLDIGSTADEFIKNWGTALEKADKAPVEKAAKEGVGETTKEAIAEKIKEQSSIEEIGGSLGAALLNAGALTEESAQQLGTNLVTGFITGIASKIDGADGLVGTVADAVNKGLQSGDDTYKAWYSRSLLPNVDQACGTVLEYVQVLVPEVLGQLGQMMSSILQGASELSGAIIDGISSLGSIISSVLSVIAGSAFNWGYDIASQMASGINSGSYLVSHAVSRLASMVRSYLHFSEPDKGPLSDFHTYMPDMMKEMAKGIDENERYPEKAISNVAQMISDSMHIDAGLTGTLTGISNSVAYQTPAFANGSIVPYGLNDSSNVGFNDDTMDKFAEIMRQSIFQAFTAALSTQSKEQTSWNVYLDGKQIADSVTKWQRREDRAGGR